MESTGVALGSAGRTRFQGIEPVVGTAQRQVTGVSTITGAFEGTQGVRRILIRRMDAYHNLGSGEVSAVEVESPT